MSTSAQRTRRRGAHLKLSRCILDSENLCWHHGAAVEEGQEEGGSLNQSRRRLTMLRSILFTLAAAVGLSAAAPALAQGTVKIAVLGPMAFVQGENHWA